MASWWPSCRALLRLCFCRHDNELRLGVRRGCVSDGLLPVPMLVRWKANIVSIPKISLCVDVFDGGGGGGVACHLHETACLLTHDGRLLWGPVTRNGCLLHCELFRLLQYPSPVTLKDEPLQSWRSYPYQRDGFMERDVSRLVGHCASSVWTEIWSLFMVPRGCIRMTLKALLFLTIPLFLSSSS